MQRISVETSFTQQTTSPPPFYGSRLRHIDRRRPKSKMHFCQKVLCANCLRIQNINSFSAQNVDICKGIPSHILRIQEFGHIFWGTPQPMIILTDNKSVTRFFQTKIIPPPLWNACDFVIQFNFVIAHIPGKNNTAADYLSRMEMDPTEKLVLKIREDVETRPIEINVQSAGVSEEEQVFFTEEDNKTEQQIWERKQQSKKGLMVPETVIQIDAISENTVEEITNFTQKLRRTNQILLEQSRDPILLQLKAKLQKEEYSEEILQQDIWYKYYLNNRNRIVLIDEIVTRQYYDETGQVKYHQIFFCQSIYSRNYYKQYMARHIATRAFLKCYRKFAKNTTTPELKNTLKIG